MAAIQPSGVLHFGHLDQATCDVITYHARGGTKGRASIPAKYVRSGGVNVENRRQRFSFLVSRESLTFFGNLLALQSFLPPRVVSGYLRRRIDPKDLRDELAKARRTVQKQWEVYGKWLMSWSEVEKRVLDPNVNPQVEPLFDERRHGTPDPVSLYVARQLTEMDTAPTGRRDRDAVQASKALHLLKLGELELAETTINGVLEKAPGNPEANYAYAVMALMRAAKSDKDARYFSVMVHEVGLSQEQDFEDMLADAVFEMETRMLQLLFVMSPDGYTRYFPQWLKALRTHPIWEVEPYVAATEWAVGKVIREHVRRNLSEAEREELLKFLEERSVENARDRYVRIRESMGDPKPEAEEDWDFE